MKSANRYPELRGKGSDVKLLVSWLATVTVNIGVLDQSAVVSAATFCSTKFVSVIDRADMFLTGPQAEVVVQVWRSAKPCF